MRRLWLATPLIIFFIGILYQYIEFEYEQYKERRNRDEI